MRKALVKRGGQIIEVDVDDNHVNQLRKAQKGEQVYKPVFDEWGDEIMSSKHRTRGGKDFTKYRKYDPETGREYIEKEWFNPKTNEINYSTRDKGKISSLRGTREADAPNPYIPVELRSFPNDQPFFPWQPAQYQTGGEGSKYPLNEYGEEIRYHKEFDRRGKRITKEKLVKPADPEMGRMNSRTTYQKRVLDDNGVGRVVTRPSGLDYFINPQHSIYYGEPRDGSFIDYEINPNFNQQPRIFQMGGEPQQQMPPQQEGQAQGSQEDQIMQLIQAYAEAMGISPEEIIQELQQMDPQEQKQAIDQMAQELQGGEQAQAPEQQMSSEQMMQMGGASNIYTPDTGIEQYAPDPSWYDGGDRVAAPGNVVSWPSFPEGGRPMRRNIPNGTATRESIPNESGREITDTLRVPGGVPRRTGTSTFYRNPSAPEQEYDDSSYDYEDDYNPVRRVPFLENVADRVGDGFDNVGDFFKRLKRKRRGGRGRRRGNGLLNCKPGTNCFKFQEGGDSNGQLASDMSKPESKLQAFLELAQGYGQQNYDKALEKDVYSDIKNFQSGGTTQNEDGSSFYDYGSGYNPNKLAAAGKFQSNANQFKAKGDTFGAFANLAQSAANTVGKAASKAIEVAKVAAPIAANIAAPGSGMIVKAGMNAMDKPKGGTGAAPATGGGGGGNPLGALSGVLGGGGAGAAGSGAAGAAAGGFDPSALLSFLGKYGGNVPTAQNGGILGKVLPMAAGALGTMFAGPVGGIAAKTAVSGITGGGKSGGGGGGFDPTALISMLAKHGGSLPRYQSDVLTGQFNSGIGSFGNSPAWNFGNTGVDNYLQDFNAAYPNNPMGPQSKPAPVQNTKMADQSLNTPIDFGPQDDPITSNATNPNKDKELTTGPTFIPPKTKNNMPGMGSAISGFIGAMGNAGKAKKAQNQADMALLSDNLFDANYGSRGDYVTNTQPGTANFRPDQNIPMGYNASEFGKYGMQLAKVGTQVQNPYMSNPYSHPEAILYGEPEREVSNTLKPVKRELANLEAEVGEVAVTPGGADGIPKFFKIGGKNHYAGGTPLSLPENTFIFSKTRSMIIKDPKILKELTGSTKPASPADLAKRFDYSDYIGVLQNENSDPVERKTAQMMVESMIYKLGQIAIIQEAKKGFPSGIPLIAGPYLEKAGIDPQMLLPESADPEQEDPEMQQQMDPAMQEQMMQQQMDPRMMQEQMEPMPEQMGQPAMRNGGPYKNTGYDDIPETRKDIERRLINEARGRITDIDGGVNGADYWQQRFKAEGIDNPYEIIRGLQPKPFSQSRQANMLEQFFPQYQEERDSRDPRYMMDYETLSSRRPSYEEYAYGGSNLERYQKKGQVSNSALLNRISKDIKTYPRKINSVDSLPKFRTWDNEVPRDSSSSDNYKPKFKITPYKIGGTNIMGGPILPIYQGGNQVDRNPIQQIGSLLTGRGNVKNNDNEPTGYWDRVGKNWSNVEFSSDWNDPREDPRAMQSLKELIPFNGSDGVLDYFGNMFTLPQKTGNYLLTGLFESPSTTVSRNSQMSEGEKLGLDIVTDPMIIPEIPYAIGKGLYKGAAAGFKAAVPVAQKAALNTALAGMRVAELTTQLAAKYGPKLIELASKYIGKIPPERMVLVASRVSQAITQANNNRTPIDLDILFQKEMDKELKLNKPASTPKTLVKPKAPASAPASARTVQQAPKPAIVTKSAPVQQKSSSPAPTKSKSSSTKTTTPTTSLNSGLMKLKSEEVIWEKE
jgi:hypothetical protein